MKKKNKQASTPDVTQAFSRMAEDFILMAEDVEKGRSLAYMAVLAWNISLYPENQIPQKIEKIAQDYERCNPNVIKADLLAKDFQFPHR